MKVEPLLLEVRDPARWWSTKLDDVKLLDDEIDDVISGDSESGTIGKGKIGSTDTITISQFLGICHRYLQYIIYLWYLHQWPALSNQIQF